MASRIFLTAVELGIFQELGNLPLTASQIAEQLGADQRAMEILLNALTGMDLLKKKDDKFVNIKEVEDLLIPDRPRYIGGVFGHTVNLWTAWSRLTEVVKSGHPDDLQWTEGMRRDLAVAMKEQSKGTSNRLAALVDCSDANSMLDLGGGASLYAIAFARNYPNLKVVVCDRDKKALEVAGEEIARENIQDRIRLKEGDFFRDDIGRDYDLVLLSSVFSLFGDKENSFLLKKIKDSLRNGGRAVIWENIVDESGTKPVSAALFAVNMLVSTNNGRAYSFPEIKALLLSSGFRDIQRIPMASSQVVIGRK
jgi:predicted O-methyltransferase YrrM